MGTVKNVTNARPGRTLKRLREAAIPPSVTLHVTAEVLSCSERCNSLRCMVAQAISLLGSDIRGVSVNGEMARFNLGDRRFSYPMPAKARAAIIAFDNGETVKPFSFRLDKGYSRPILREQAWQIKGGKAKKHFKKGGRKHVTGIQLSVRRYAGMTIVERKP